MAKITSEQRKRSNNRREMTRTWEAAEWLVRDKVEQLDHLLYKMHQEARTVGVESQYIQRYVQEKLTAMINEVAKRRELEFERRASNQ